MIGTVAILNVSAGDTKLSFDPTNPAEVKRAAKIVKDMIRKGFVLLVEVGRNEKGPIYQRAHDFDEKTAEYIIAGETQENVEQAEEAGPEARAPARAGGKAKKGWPKLHARVAAGRTSAVAVARTAGG